VFWTYSYSPVRDKDGTVQGTLVVCSETTEQVLSERRLRALLAINADFLSEVESSSSQPLLNFARTIIEKLEHDPADIPFASLYLLSQGEVLPVGSTASTCVLSTPDDWPLIEAVAGKKPLLVEDLTQRFGELVCPPWAEPVTRAYVLPLEISGSSFQGAMIFGISPRLPFDDRYRTFLQLVGSRIATLLQSEIHQLEIAQAAERFRRLAEANPFGMVIGNLGGELSYVNPALLQTLGYSKAEVHAGKVRWNTLTPEEYAAADANAIEQLRRSGRCEVYEKVYLAKNGRRIPILVGASILESPRGEPEVAAFVTDLTPLKAAEEALRRANAELDKKVTERTAELQAEVLERNRIELNLRKLTGRLLLVQDEERRHMARELHDHAGQTLTALSINLGGLYSMVRDQDAKIAALVAESQQLSNDLSKEIRTFSYLLHPPLLDEVGLGSALQWYVSGFSERSKINVELDLPAGIGRMANELELVVFRVVQESLTNIHRHSGSQSAKLYLRCSDGSVKLEISDRGKGISAETQSEMRAARAGVGVRGMEERVRQFGGTLEIVSDGAGTKVIVVLPLTAETK
jgi:PAS domain S-box-containing protein